MRPSPIMINRRPAKPGILASLLLWIVILCAAAIGLAQIRAPQPVASDAAPHRFSAERALADLEAISREAHPVGSAAHDEVRDYLLQRLRELGLTPEVQRTTSVSVSGHTTADVENIVARIEGKAGGGAIMLAAHYDSTPGGPGAADDGAAVAAILETVRALQTGEPLGNDLIVLLSDAEENGLLGARSFVKEHPWAKEVRLVLNFEARGNQGPSFMFETSERNGWLIEQFSKQASSPVAYSLIYNLYKLLPNDTDFSVFKEAGMQGLNFAFGNGMNAYHTTLDTVDRLDKSSLQHHGEYMLSLTRHFGNSDLAQPQQTNDRVYFNVFGSAMATYPQSWAVPLAAIAAVFYIATLIHGFRSRSLTLAGYIGGFAAALASLALAFGIAAAAWSGLSRFFAEYRWMLESDPTVSNPFFWSFLCLTVAAMLLVFGFLAAKMRTENGWAGSLLLWLILTVATSYLLPGGSYLFVWPLLFSLIGLNIAFRTGTTEWPAVLGAIPGILFMAPIIHIVYMLMGLPLAGALCLLTALAMTLVIPAVRSFPLAKGWVAPLVMLAVSVAIAAAASWNVMPSSSHPNLSQIVYFKDADRGRAIWASGQTPDNYTSALLAEGTSRGDISGELPFLTGGLQSFVSQVYFNDAPVYDEPAPEVEKMDDAVNGDRRTLTLRIRSLRQAEELTFTTNAKMTVYGASVNGQPLIAETRQVEADDPFSFKHIGSGKNGIELRITVGRNDDIRFYAADCKYMLPNEVPQRPEELISYRDMTFVFKHYQM